VYERDRGEAADSHAESHRPAGHGRFAGRVSFRFTVYKPVRRKEGREVYRQEAGNETGKHECSVDFAYKEPVEMIIDRR
jgi:hypothetical protein